MEEHIPEEHFQKNILGKPDCRYYLYKFTGNYWHNSHFNNLLNIYGNLDLAIWLWKNRVFQWSGSRLFMLLYDKSLNNCIPHETMGGPMV